MVKAQDIRTREEGKDYRDEHRSCHMSDATFV